MFRFRSRYQKIFICSTVIITFFCAVLFVLRDREDCSSDIVQTNLSDYVLRYDGQLRTDTVWRENECDQKYGVKMFDIWKSTEFEICTNESTRTITCYLRLDKAVTRRLCLLTNTKIRLYEPYYVANTSDLLSIATVDMHNDTVC